MRRFFAILVAGAAVLSAMPLSAQQQQPLPAAIDSSTLMLNPGDLVRIQIWREADMSGDFPVDEGGVVTLPLIGPKRVTGIPIPRLRDELIEAYRAHLRNPSINITPLRRVNVLGEVARPGLYPVDPTVSLAGVVALAGGATPTGDLRRIRIVRGGQVLTEHAATTQTVSSMDVRSGDQIYVDRRGWFDRNSTFVVSALLSITSIVITLAR
ncbi:polysaccharide biosynthesis/export family protein [Longimicrobium sp.]|uniref:polysaccharide biosynthesis/export family protein n=1 Tax=Longimicrobium sp. TaxID=2029185 RepID=UPI002C84E9AF|nr:polysaccharide biosynthesis/export family protein [Longimicrobium sp.]HSU17078.1 polysaccharide biosynthesis/export family protein [Longimicrobium sp.]